MLGRFPDQQHRRPGVDQDLTESARDSEILSGSSSSAHIRRFFNSRVYVDELQVVWTDQLPDGDLPPVSANKRGVGIVRGRRIVDETLNGGLGQGGLSACPRRPWCRTESIADALTVLMIRSVRGEAE